MTPDGGFSISGEIRDYDGEFFALDTVFGAVMVDAALVLCDGTACPDPSAFAPLVSLSGAGTIGRVLVPALIDGYADRMGYRVARTVLDDAHVIYDLSDAADGQAIVTFAIRLSTSDEGFADLLAGEAELALSMREIRAEELARARDAGLGDLAAPARSRVLALDAVVPVAGAGNPVSAISMRDLARVYSGRVESWADLGGEAVPIERHLLADGSGIAGALEDRVVRRYGFELSGAITRHSDAASLAAAVAATPGALGVTLFSELGALSPLAISGPCGFPSVISPEVIKTEDYPLTSPLFAYQPARRLPRAARDFLAYVQSPAASLIIRRAGFVDQRPEAIPLEAQGLRMANAVRQAGSGVGLADLKTMVDRLFGAERLTVTFRFEEGSSDLDAQSRFNVDLLAREISRGAFDGRTLLFAGFSDGRGDARQNGLLSERRAEAVRDAVLQAGTGTDLSRIEIEVAGFGEAMPMACDDVAWGQRINRRVEVWVR